MSRRQLRRLSRQFQTIGSFGRRIQQRHRAGGRWHAKAATARRSSSENRNSCMLIGENPGTVPAGFRERMAAAARLGNRIGAIVSRGGRPDLAAGSLPEVRAPTLLIVGGEDPGVLALNRRAFDELRCKKAMEIIPGATHLFSEPGALESVASLAAEWFERRLGAPSVPGQTHQEEPMFKDRSDAGRQLAQALAAYREDPCAVFALPRGGVAVAAEVAKALGAPLDLILVRKIGAPMQPELAMGAVVDGVAPVTVRNREIIEASGATEAEFQAASRRELAEIERRRKKYLGDRKPLDAKGRVAIVIDDGIATGATVRAALRALRKREPKKLVLAVPVAPAETLGSLEKEADEVVCLEAPAHFGAVGYFYSDFHQLTDDDVRELLQQAQALRHSAGSLHRAYDMDEIMRITGDIDASKAMAILALEPTLGEIEQAVAWLEGRAETLAKDGRPLTDKVAQIYDLLAADEEENSYVR